MSVLRVVGCEGIGPSLPPKSRRWTACTPGRPSAARRRAKGAAGPKAQRAGGARIGVLARRKGSQLRERAEGGAGSQLYGLASSRMNWSRMPALCAGLARSKLRPGARLRLPHRPHVDVHDLHARPAAEPLLEVVLRLALDLLRL
eukprot:6119777-Prymnesium_polylepis.1